MKNIRIEAERKFADETRTGIGIENPVQLLSLIAGRFDDFSVSKIQPYVIETNPLINRRCVKCHMTLHRNFNRAAEHLAVRNVAVAAANHCRNSFDAEMQIGSSAFDLDAVG